MIIIIITIVLLITGILLCYLEAGKTFETEEERETVEYMQNNLLDILKGEEND